MESQVVSFGTFSQRAELVLSGTYAFFPDDGLYKDAADLYWKVLYNKAIGRRTTYPKLKKYLRPDPATQLYANTFYHAGAFAEFALRSGLQFTDVVKTTLEKCHADQDLWYRLGDACADLQKFATLIDGYRKLMEVYLAASTIQKQVLFGWGHCFSFMLGTDSLAYFSGRKELVVVDDAPRYQLMSVVDERCAALFLKLLDRPEIADLEISRTIKKRFADQPQETRRLNNVMLSKDEIFALWRLLRTSGHLVAEEDLSDLKSFRDSLRVNLDLCHFIVELKLIYELVETFVNLLGKIIDLLDDKGFVIFVDYRRDVVREVVQADVGQNVIGICFDPYSLVRDQDNVAKFASGSMDYLPVFEFFSAKNAEANFAADTLDYIADLIMDADCEAFEFDRSAVEVRVGQYVREEYGDREILRRQSLNDALGSELKLHMDAVHAEFKHLANKSTMLTDAVGAGGSRVLANRNALYYPVESAKRMGRDLGELERSLLMPRMPGSA